MKRKATSLVMILSLLATSTFMTGCFGSFQLTQGIYGWNKSVSGNKFIQWFVFILMNVIPVYGIGVFVDAFIFNTLEFWTGSNPIADNGEAPATKTVMLDENTKLEMVRLDETKMSATVTTSEKTQQFFLIFNDNGMEMRDGNGALIAEIQDTEGLIEVLNGAGEPVASYDAQDAKALQDAYELNGSQGATDVAMKRWTAVPSGVAAR